MAKKLFRVYPNPFTFVDHDGQLAGACPCDGPEHVGMMVRKWVGARLDDKSTVLLEKLTKDELAYRDPRQQTRFAFDFAAPTETTVTEYYRDRLRAGELIPADVATHVLAGFPAQTFVDPKTVLAKAKASALEHWRANYGPDEKPDGIDALDQAIAALGAPPAEPVLLPLDPKPSKPSKGA